MNALVTQVALRVRPVRGLSLLALVSTGLKRFDNGDRIGDVPGILFVFDPATIPGFVHGTTYVRAGIGFDLDTRDTPVRAAAGLVVHGAFDYTHGIDGDAATYERLAGSVGIPIDLWSRTHVLWLSAATALTWQNDAPVPFSELPTLGGPNDLRGFRFQDFRDFTSFYATAEYRWPIWMWVDGALFFDYGGVFGKNYSGFGARRMQPDVGVALRLVTSERFLIRMQLGYGFGEGFNFSVSGSAL
jgi:outer membrane protein assembly factor BamA